MFARFLVPLLSLIGFFSAVKVVLAGVTSLPPAQPVSLPAANPYAITISGAGIVEASSENISIGTPISGVVTSVNVHPGEKVSAETLLFALDDRELTAKLLSRQAALQVAQAQLATEKVQRAQAEEDFKKVEALAKGGAVSREVEDTRRFAREIAVARVAAAEAHVAAAEADIAATLTDLDRIKVKAPFAGKILQVNIHLGEFAQAGSLPTPLILMGASQETLHVRVDIDENDAWRLRPGANATAFVRGNSKLSAPLSFVRLEPYVVPKKSLTGGATERVDTRVLQVIYKIDKLTFPLYVGQLLDVFIESEE